MTRRRPEQLVLPGLRPAGVQLRQELTGTKAAGARRHDAMTALTTQVARLTEQLETARHAVHYWQQAHAKVSLAVIALQCQLASRQPAGTDEPGLDARTLRRLLALCHPDRWCQGQPATALAHELTVSLNALRQPRGEGSL